MRDSRTRSVVLLVFSLLSLLMLARLKAEAQTPKDLPDVMLSTTSVAAFKNGLGFFIRQGTAHTLNGQAKIPFVPEASLGSLWLAANESGVTIDELVAYRYKVSKERSVDSIEELLQTSVGKTLTVTFNNKDYTGEVLGFSKAEPPNPSSRANAISVSAIPARPYHLLMMKVGNLGLEHGCTLGDASFRLGGARYHGQGGQRSQGTTLHAERSGRHDETDHGLPAKRSGVDPVLSCVAAG